jgi:hypothetical protein
MESLIGSNVDMKELYDVEGTIHFTNSTKLKSDMNTIVEKARERDSLGDHTFLITGFPADQLPNDDDDDADAKPLPTKGKILFLTDLKALIITMTGAPHEAAGRAFYSQFDRKLVAMNCAEDLCPVGGAIRNMIGVSKEPDECWRPHGKTYITLAVETGASESNSKLAIDAKIWLEHQESHVKQVLTIKISRAREEVRFCVWKAPPHGRQTTAGHPPRAAVDHSALVTLENQQPVVDGTITISFEDALERKPRQGTAEKDFVFSARELGAIARLAYEEMGSIPLDLDL